MGHNVIQYFKYAKKIKGGKGGGKKALNASKTRSRSLLLKRFHLNALKAACSGKLLSHAPEVVRSRLTNKIDTGVPKLFVSSDIGSYKTAYAKSAGHSGPVKREDK